MANWEFFTEDELRCDGTGECNMDEAFICSTGIGILPCYWEKWKSNYKVTSIIKKSLNTKINKNK